jgi:hypothetical protein
MARRVICLAASLAFLLFSACGGQGDAVHACDGTPLSAQSIKLPSDFPIPGAVVLTKSSKAGPSQVVEGYFRGDLPAAYRQWRLAFEHGGFAILFDELEREDSEISYSAPNLGSIGQVALRSDCEEDDRTFVHITNRPA